MTAATVQLLRSKDSSRVTMIFTDSLGNFRLDSIQEGSYLLYASYLGYQPLLLTVAVTDGKITDLANLQMQKTGLTLLEVEIIENRPAMVMKKDTLEFNADYFHTRENALLEELLKKLPGLQVGRDGSITIQGETVQRILIDGEPFLGDDPKTVTRNLAAMLIDKVQLIDAKPELVSFSGAANGQTEKVINITIKQKYRRAFTGRVNVGYGTDQRFAVNGHLHRFGDGQGLSLLGNGNNTHGYPHEGSANSIASNSQGITRSWQACGNYHSNLGQGLRIMSSYTVNNSRIVNQRNSARQYLLPDTTWYYNRQDQTEGNSTAQQLFLRADYKPDTLHTLIAAVRLGHNSGNDLQVQRYTSLNGQQQLLNSGSTRLYNTNSTPKLSTAISFRKKLRKAGRSIGGELATEHQLHNGQQSNHSFNLFKQPGGDTDADTLDQQNSTRNRNQQITLYLNYTEPVLRGHLLNFTYGYIQDNNHSNKQTYDYDAGKGAYDLLNDSLSNAFRNTVSRQLFMLSLEKQGRRYDYSVGGYLQHIQLNSYNLDKQYQFRLRSIHLLPGIRFNYMFTDHKQLRYSYYGNVEAPNVAQLQPVPDNSNPLHIQLGNPDLQPAYVHSLGLGYKALNPGTMRSFNIETRAAFTINKIVNASWFDSLGRQVSQPVNMNGAHKVNVNMSNAIPIKQLHTFINTNTAFQYNREAGFVNGLKGYTGNFTASQNISFSYTHQELFDAAVEGGMEYNSMHYSLQPTNNIHYFSYTVSFDGEVNLPQGFKIGGTLDYWLNTSRAAGYNRDGLLLNGSLSKSVMKQRGKITLQGFDLLNRNMGIRRHVGANYIEDTQSRVLQRFFLLSLSYFIKPGGNKGAQKTNTENNPSRN
ncbi:outer membrane beta-barrel protein [Chitinophaga japonensis]